MWPSSLPAIQVRIARQTNQIDELIRFYCVGLGLQIITSFKGHFGYDGVMIGLPGVNYHLEFVHHAGGSPGETTNRENLLVFYIPDEQAVVDKATQLKNMGYKRVPSENPWWDAHGAITIEDPDGWRIVLQPGNGF